MSDTPKSDAALAAMIQKTGYAEASAIDVSVARELERENAALRQQRDDADQYITAIWRADRLPSPLPDRLFNRLTNQPKTLAEATGLREGPALELAKQLYREGHTNLPPNLG